MARTAVIGALVLLSACGRMDEAPKVKTVDTRPETALQQRTTQTALIAQQVRARMGDKANKVDPGVMTMVAQNARSKQQREMADEERLKQGSRLGTVYINDMIQRRKAAQALRTERSGIQPRR